jgi:catechol 2,3-dioxygenase-like lactoylglutathione lyase family enzyme
MSLRVSLAGVVDVQRSRRDGAQRGVERAKHLLATTDRSVLEVALDFYTTKLGFKVLYDIREPEWTWVVVAPAGSDSPALVLSVPGAPFMSPDAARQVLELVASGAITGGILATDDCRGDHQALAARGVEFQEEPMERDYGIDAAFRDPSGNLWRMTQRVCVAMAPGSGWRSDFRRTRATTAAATAQIAIRRNAEAMLRRTRAPASAAPAAAPAA